MAINAYITSDSWACTLDNDFNATDKWFDRGLTFVKDGKILNNLVSLSISEAPDGCVIGVDPYGRIIGRIPSSVDPNSGIKLSLVYNNVEFECELAILPFIYLNLGDAIDFDEIQDEGGEGGESETPST